MFTIPESDAGMPSSNAVGGNVTFSFIVPPEEVYMSELIFGQLGDECSATIGSFVEAEKTGGSENLVILIRGLSGLPQDATISPAGAKRVTAILTS